MSSDYYFKKWKKILQNLTDLVELDIEYQVTKTPDKDLCQAVQRLNGILASYIKNYNDALEGLKQNLQVQKTEYIHNVVEAIVARILELKDQLRHLEGACNQFLSNGLVDHKLTPYDVEFSDIPAKHQRPECVRLLIEKAFRNAKDVKEENTQDNEYETIDEAKDELIQNLKWWEDDVEIETKDPKATNITGVYEIEEKLSEETLRRKNLLILIQAHERNRQVTRKILRKKRNRELWEKELKGILNPPAPIALRERSAQLIQTVLRSYFKIKRDKIRDCMLDEKLNITLCRKPDMENIERDKEMRSNHSIIFKKYQKEWEAHCNGYKQNYLKRRRDDIAEDLRGYFRNWFYKWYTEARFFYDIPKDIQGGSTLILREEILTPAEWLNKYETYLQQKRASKGKTVYQLKLEKQEALEEEMTYKREELKKKTLEAELLKKIMKNPTLHPGYRYPTSKKTDAILQAIANYYKDWDHLDNQNNLFVKEKYVKIVNEENLCMEAKIEVCKSVVEDMRDELQILKKSLKAEYIRNKEQMPEKIKEKSLREKSTKLKRKTFDKNKICDQLTELAVRGYLKEYPVTGCEDFLGDSNYAGADLRCSLRRASPLGGETRALWWERCRETIHGFRRILLVGPTGSGKTILVHSMATINEAILYELNPLLIEKENLTPECLQKLINSIAACALYTQPSIIYIKSVNLLYCAKIPSEETKWNLDLIKRFFIRKLFKKFHKHDNVTIIATCVEPWTTKSKQMLKKFNSVILVPQTNYSTVYIILKEWMLHNRVIPRNLDIESLAHVLQDYSFGYLKTALNKFLNADRIIKIAAFGLKPQDIYNYMLDDNGIKIDYQKYIKWYTEKTHWGKLEKKRLDERIEFQLLVDKWKEKMEKNKRKEGHF